MLALLLLTLAQEPAEVCRGASLQALRDAAVMTGRAGPGAARSALTEAARQDSACAPLLGAGWSLTGWVAARAAARVGGTSESLSGASTALTTLETLGTRPAWRVESEYARAAIRAAMAAAQDERSEMAIYLAHARGLSERLALAGATPQWPLPIDALEGDLWLEVDRYEDAQRAFVRAQQIDANGFVLTGLARTLDRLGDQAGACRTYRLAVDATVDGALLDESRGYLARPSCTR